MEANLPDTESNLHSTNYGNRKKNFSVVKKRIYSHLSKKHSETPYLRRLPLPALLIITLLVFINLVAWAICGLVLASYPHLLSTAALAYTLGLRHALDADHISAIDLMTRRLIATGQRPVTVGTFFSLGHSTIVIITSIVVAATAAGVSKRFNGFSNVGGIIGTSVSAAFLILLGIMNAYILYKLIVQIQKVIKMQPDQGFEEAWKFEGGGCLFRVLKRMFKLIDRPWKMYPLGVLFGLGFDTSSEIALLGISSIQGAKGTSIWLILLFPVLFTVGMCLVDTADGALMMSLYVAPLEMVGKDTKKQLELGPASGMGIEREQPDRSVREDDTDTQNTKLLARDATTDVGELTSSTTPPPAVETASAANRIKDPLTFLYYSIVLTSLTVLCAIVIGMIQLLSLILNTAHPTGPFWDGVSRAGDYYDVIGGAICGSFILVGGASVLCYKPWKKWVDRIRDRERKRINEEQEVEGSGMEQWRVRGLGEGDFPRNSAQPDNRRSETCRSVRNEDDNEDNDGNAAVIVECIGDEEVLRSGRKKDIEPMPSHSSRQGYSGDGGRHTFKKPRLHVQEV